ncbi:MAG: VanZ family protein [Bacilli bacterium]
MSEALINILNKSWPTFVIFLSISIILRVAYIRHSKKKFSLHEELFLLLFVVYILLLFESVTYNEIGYGGSNFIPFKEILRYPFASEGFYRQVIGNIVLFIPFGYFITHFIKIKNIFSAFILTFLSSLTIETVQYFIGRTFDIDDIILNVAGGVLGFLLYIALEAIKKHLPKFFQKEFIYTILSIILISFIVLYFLDIYGVWSFI